MDFGVGFQPGQAQTNGTRSPDQARQEAVRLISLRLPKVVGGSALAPAPLLQGGGSQGNPFANSAIGQTQRQVQPDQPMATAPVQGAQSGLSPVLQAIMAMAAPQASQSAPPAPHFTPGVVPGDHPEPPPPITREWQAPQGTPMLTNIQRPTNEYPVPTDASAQAAFDRAPIEPNSAPSGDPGQMAPWLLRLQQKYTREG